MPAGFANGQYQPRPIRAGNLSNLLRAPFRQPIDTVLNIMLR